MLIIITFMLLFSKPAAAAIIFHGHPASSGFIGVESAWFGLRPFLLNVCNTLIMYSSPLFQVLDIYVCFLYRLLIFRFETQEKYWRMSPFQGCANVIYLYMS